MISTPTCQTGLWLAPAPPDWHPGRNSALLLDCSFYMVRFADLNTHYMKAKWIKRQNINSDQYPYMPNGVMASASSPWLASREEFCTFIRLLILYGTVCRSQHSLYESKMNQTTYFISTMISTLPSQTGLWLAAAPPAWHRGNSTLTSDCRCLLYG